MKTTLRTICAILGTLVIIASVHAETPVNTSVSSSLSNISVKIGAKTYSGEEAKNLLLARVKTMKDAKKTADEKQKFLEQFNAKLSKLAGNYEKRGGKAGDIAKVLRAVETELKGEISTFSVDNMKPNTTVNNSQSVKLTTSEERVISSVGTNENRSLKEMMAMTKTPIETFYVNMLVRTLEVQPSTGWKSEKVAYDYMISSYVTGKKFPIDSEIIIRQAVHDALSRKIGTQYLEEAFKTLPESWTK